MKMACLSKKENKNRLKYSNSDVLICATSFPLQAGDSPVGPKSPRSPLAADSPDTSMLPTAAQCNEEVELRMALAQSEDRISELVSINKQLQREVSSLKNNVSHDVAMNSCFV